MRRALLVAWLALLFASPASAQQGTAVNPVVGSVWTWLGPTFGADWVAPQAGDTPEVFGGIGDGLANDTGPMLSCFEASSIASPCTLRAGATYLVDNLVIPSNVYVQGGGTIKRLPNSASTGFLHGDCVNLNMRGIIIDGNKAYQTVAADNLYCLNYKNVHLDGITSRSAKSASGIVLNTSVDEAAHTYSGFDGVFAHDNDQNGILGITAAWKLQLNNVTATYNGTYGAYFGPTGPANNLDSVLKYITVRGGDYSYNGNSGLAAQGFITGYIGGEPSYGPGIEPVIGAKFVGVTAANNDYYGIVLQARWSTLADSLAKGNAAAGTFGGGVLGNGEGTTISNVTSVDNAPGGSGMGLDMGCGRGVNVIGGDYSGNQWGINAGCSQFSSIRNANITNNTVYAIYALAAEGSGDGYGIPGYTHTLVITGNRISCLPDQYGIVIQDGGLGIEVSNNYVQNCDAFKAIIVQAASAEIRNNTVPKSTDPSILNASGTEWDAFPDTTGTLAIPVWVDTVVLYGTNNFHSIKSQDEVALGDGVYSVLIVDGGFGYTPSSVATWTGCTTPPTGQVFVTRAGAVTGYRFTTHGSGCVNPTVSFSIGTGATSIAYQAPLSYSFQKDLMLLVSGGATLTIGSGGNIALASPLTGAGTSSTIKFHWAYEAGLYETSRAIH